MIGNKIEIQINKKKMIVNFYDCSALKIFQSQF